MHIKYILLGVSFMIGSTSICAQEERKDAQIIRQIYDQALKYPKAYEWLDFLCNQIGGRLSGSPQASAAVNYTQFIMDTLKADRVFLQEVKVPHWVRGKAEVAKIINSKKLGSQEVPVCALGNSVGTGKGGLRAQVVEVQNFEDLEKLGKSVIEGKIVFFNRPLDPTLVRTFEAYGGAVNQRFSGPSEAAKYGAVGCVVRSMTTALDDHPHTGSLGYQLNIPKIPAVAISTNGAELLSALLKDDAELQFYFETHCQMLEDADSHNVVGEIKGSEFPEEIIVVGGHLDAWDTGQGAHDDGAGCVQSLEVLRIFKALNIRPKRTVRIVMFMNEENGLRGGRKYAELAEENKENHLAAIESDAGGFTPRGIGVSLDKNTFEQIKKWQSLFDPYDIDIQEGGGGADIGPLRSQGTTTMSLRPDSQRYFDLHHAAIDTFDKVNQRELQLGAAAMTAMVYLLAEYGL